MSHDTYHYQSLGRSYAYTQYRPDKLEWRDIFLPYFYNARFDVKMHPVEA